MRQDDVTGHALGAETIRHALDARDIEDARRLFLEYASWLKVDLCFQGFDRELATLPGAYAPPRGRLLLVGEPGRAFACIALRPLLGSDSTFVCGQSALAPCTSRDDKRKSRLTPVESDPIVGEVKRLYVQPARRGEGWGGRVARALIREARAIGYRELKLDTLAWMNEARALYARLGFKECAPYYDNPLDGVVYMSLALPSLSPERERRSAPENRP
jgi:ribosomal protein S18 acetylase RimI-like enzyme